MTGVQPHRCILACIDLWYALAVSFQDVDQLLHALRVQGTAHHVLLKPLGADAFVCLRLIRCLSNLDAGSLIDVAVGLAPVEGRGATFARGCKRGSGLLTPAASTSIPNTGKDLGIGCKGGTDSLSMTPLKVADGIGAAGEGLAEDLHMVLLDPARPLRGLGFELPIGLLT